eukprot:gene928-9836_t
MVSTTFYGTLGIAAVYFLLNYEEVLNQIKSKNYYSKNEQDPYVFLSNLNKQQLKTIKNEKEKQPQNPQNEQQFFVKSKL